MTAARDALSIDMLQQQIARAYPDRRTSSDGTVASAQHHAQNPHSDHEANKDGYVLAVDFTHDPQHGFDSYVWADYMAGLAPGASKPDTRIQYIISNRRIWNADISPEKWRPYHGDNPHDMHVHISLKDSKKLYNDTSAWNIGPTMAANADAPAAVDRPVLRKGSTGDDVRRLQQLLGVTVDGDFGPDTQRAVIAFQKANKLAADGGVGPYTWRELQKRPVVVSSTPAPNDIDRIVSSSKLQQVNWHERGIAPPGYLKGMARMYATMLRKLQAGDRAAVEMARQDKDDLRDDALTWYRTRFNAAGMRNDAAGIDTLRHLFVLMIGLGMRESSGRYCEGRDRSAHNVTATTAEAGLFQMSWDASSSTAILGRLLEAYQGSEPGLADVFKEGVHCSDSDFQVYGTGDGAVFQKVAKNKPAFAVEAAGVGLRNIRTHWGPINRREVELRPEADEMLKQVEKSIGLNAVA